MIFRKESSWIAILERYTRTRLTVPSDHPEAIRGIADDIQRSWKDRYLSEYGVWEEKLVAQLLWTHDGPSFDDGHLPDLPTWSWAATNCAKNRPRTANLSFYANPWKSKEMAQFTIASPGHLEVVGHLNGRPATFSTINGQIRESLYGLRNLYGLNGTIKQHWCFIRQDTEYEKELLGMARFDIVGKTSCTHVLFALRAPRIEGDDYFKYPSVDYMVSPEVSFFPLVALTTTRLTRTSLSSFACGEAMRLSQWPIDTGLCYSMR